MKKYYAGSTLGVKHSEETKEKIKRYYDENKETLLYKIYKMADLKKIEVQIYDAITKKFLIKLKGYSEVEKFLNISN